MSKKGKKGKKDNKATELDLIVAEYIKAIEYEHGAIKAYAEIDSGLRESGLNHSHATITQEKIQLLTYPEIFNKCLQDNILSN